MSTSSCILEVCVDSLESARNAELGGASRLELCSSLSLGGLTPTVGLVQSVKKCVKLPIYVMIRPRDGDFVYDEDELLVMEQDITSLKEVQVDGFVFGVLHLDCTVDREACLRLISSAYPLPCTFHRAFDVTTDAFVAMEELIQLGFRRILTSGQQQTAETGLELIVRLRERAGERIVIMAGAGVTERNASSIVMASRVTEIHGSASRQRESRPNSIRMGSEPEVGRKRVTSPDLVKLIVQSISDHAPVGRQTE
ncbi:Copper homeostasis protein cutC [Daphnia magna]|uniref:Copper homeostasis protein cutC homolog n=1 Tax=Daphnia magna TaxID=35525 RepID=A0A164VML7_9CRUS|nr:Copper homeostasis protein cutC [Daphnia magna]